LTEEYLERGVISLLKSKEHILIVILMNV